MRNHGMVWRFLFLNSIICTIAAAQSARKTIPTIAKSANGSVVSIVMSDKDGKPIAQGSGFFVSKDGLIVTNYHVIAEGSSAVAKLPDGAFYAVDGVLGSDKERDIAVIKAHGQNFRTLALGNSDRIQVGEEVVAIGNPLSLESTVSNGIVSGMRTVKEEGGKFLQITAPISHGSSGGPLFNMAGEVIGITTAGLKGGENLNFAIPINDAKHLVASPWTEVLGFPNEKEESAAKSNEDKFHSNEDNFHIVSYDPSTKIVRVRHHNKLFTAITNRVMICPGDYDIKFGDYDRDCKRVSSIAVDLVGADIADFISPIRKKLLAGDYTGPGMTEADHYFDVDGYALGETYGGEFLGLIETFKDKAQKKPWRSEEWTVIHIEEVKP